ncbi:hypothetical protein KP509_37G060100 [Ceratopteris richardii]|uniref:Uncharacterized protein n=1 Tax=Ceratopteris richardii TaxID=49495 RepID=A0A8T2Q9J1_CERRI|nr:hypothetical protein KP509_37G060100 [Ceratopteris richardii]
MLYGQALSSFAPILKKNMATLKDYERFFENSPPHLEIKSLIIPTTPIEICLALVLPLIALLDSRASSCFIDEGLVKKHRIPILQKNKIVVAQVVDGQTLASRDITMESTPFRVHPNGHDSHICFNVISSPVNLVIIGMPWQ